MEADRFTENGIPAQENCPLAPLSSFRIGGTARLALFPQTKAQLLTCLDLARRENIPFEVVGNGSNLLFPDGVYTGLMIFTRNLRAAEPVNIAPYEQIDTCQATLPHDQVLVFDWAKSGL